MTPARHSIVIGGGFVGLSAALHLQRIGRKVTLVEKAPEIAGAASASYGNAGTMAAYANVPVNSPAVLRRLPGMLMDPSSPLSIKKMVEVIIDFSMAPPLPLPRVLKGSNRSSSLH